MSYNGYNNSNQNGGHGNCPPRTSNGSRGQAALPYSRMSANAMNPGNGGGPYATMSSPNTYSGQQQQYVYQQQMQMSNATRGRQQVGRRSCRPGTSMQGQRQPQNTNMQAMVPMQQQQQQAPQGASVPNQYGSQGNGSPINVNISAAMLASANNTSAYSDRGETGAEGNPNVKYIPLSWDSILGKTGMNGMKVSMAPPSGTDPNQNRQLKISFGGQTGVSQQGETPLRVVSFQPVSTGRMDASGKGQLPMNFAVGQPGGQTPYMSQGQGQQAARSCNCPNCRR